MLGKDRSPVERIQEVIYGAGFRSTIYGPYNLRGLDGFSTGRDVARLAPKLIIVHHSAFYRERPEGNPSLLNFITEVSRRLRTKPYFLVYSYAFKNEVPDQKALAKELGAPALATEDRAEAMAVEDRDGRITTKAVKEDLAARVKRIMRKFPDC